MSSDTTLDAGHHPNIMNNIVDSGIMPINQDGEWDMNLLDELSSLVDTEELFQAMEHSGYNGHAPDLDFDIDLPPWNSSETGSTCTDGELSVNSFSPAHTLSTVPSPSSIETLSPNSILDEALSPLSQPSPASVCSESSGFSEAPLPAKKPHKWTIQAARGKAGQPVKRPIQLSTKVSIQPRPVLTAAAPLQAGTIIIQSLPTATVMPFVKPTPISIQPAPPAGRPVVLSQTGQVLHIHTPQPVAGSHLVTMSSLRQDGPAPGATPSMVSVTLRSPSSDDDSKVCQRQQRMIKNRESASQSRKKKKEYLLTLEARLRLALFENEALKSENGTLKKQLEGLLCENTVLKTTAPKRRAVCLLAVLLFLMLNVGPKSLLRDEPGSKLPTGGSTLSGRHLLGFSPDVEADTGPESPAPTTAQSADSSEDKALMVVKDPIFHRRPLPCQPPVNRTKCAELTSELRGWVHRHEVEQTKFRRMSNSQHKPTRTFLKQEDKDGDLAHIVTVQYTDSSEEKNPGSELQVYYAPHRTYSDFFDEMNRRGDTFYVVSFRRDHLLLPATSHNKGRRPKMSVVLPAININDSIIKDKEFEVMMQIDCEVTDTRILHIKSSTIPPVLRANRTDTLYPPSPADSQAGPPVGVLMGSA